MRVEEEYSDILQNIESAIVTVYEANPDLVDRDVLAAIDLLLRGYDLEKRNRSGFRPAPAGRARGVYDQCRRICEWRLGRQTLNEDKRSTDDPVPGELTVSELMRCLKHLRKSIRLWHKQGGRQGYLSYVREFIIDANSQLRI